LLRPQIDTSFRALWSLKYATDEQVIKIEQNGSKPFPEFKLMAETIDCELDANGLLIKIASAWSTLSSFTHSGLEQLGRRFSPNGAPPYDECW
jgi:hypothetical protein